jgi:transposase
MPGTIKIEIVESETVLLELLKAEKNSKNQEKLQVLYWLKTKQIESGSSLAKLLGHHQTTISRWLSTYRAGGLNALLNNKYNSGRKKIISPEVRELLKEELKDPEGFSSYQEIQTWLKLFFDYDVSYSLVHKLVRYQLKAKLKVPRPVNIKQKEGAVEDFKKNSQTC